MKKLRSLFSVLTLAGTALMLFAGPNASAQNLCDWSWVNRLGTSIRFNANNPGPISFPPSLAYSNPERVAADAAGNVVVAGAYDNDMIFGTSSVRYQSPGNAGGPVASSYLAKYTANGILAWALNLSSNGYTLVDDLAMDAAGNTYIMGHYYQQLVIGGVVVDTATDASRFLAKITPTGTVNWFTRIQAPALGFDVEKLAVDEAGNCAISASFSTATTVYGVPLGGTPGGYTAVLRYDTTGVFIGVFAIFFDTSYSGTSSIALSPTGDVYLGGGFTNGTIQFGNLPAITANAASGATAYVVKFDNSNTAVWQQVTNGNSGQIIAALAIGPRNRCYAVGSFSDGALLLGSQAVTPAQVSATGQDLFLARFAPDGTIETLTAGGGTGRVLGLAVGPQGEASISTEGGLRWGNVQLPGPTWPPASGTTVPAGIVQFDSLGVPQRGWQAGASFITTSLAVDGANHPLIVGCTGGTQYTFGSQHLTFSPPYNYDVLVAKTASSQLLGSRPAAQVAGLALYPNPAQRLVEVRTTSTGAVQLQLLDALGRTVKTEALPAGQTRLDLTGIAPGSYTVQVTQGSARSFRHLTVVP